MTLQPMAVSPLPAFHYAGAILKPETLRYAPHPDIIHPSVIDTAGLVAPLAKYYLYYAPHDAPGGICLALADTPEGPWREYAHNPIIGHEWAPHYRVSHVSSPHARWHAGERRLFLYFHGENDTTRYATSTDGIHFTYGGVAVTTADFEPGTTEASYARVFAHDVAGSPAAYVMLIMGNCNGTRNVYLASSPDGRRWTGRPAPLLRPPPGYGQMGPGWLFAWERRWYILAFANLIDAPTFDPISDLHLYATTPALDQATHLGMLLDHTFAGGDNFRICDPCLLVLPDRLCLFLNAGRRLQQYLALAVAPRA